MVSEGFRRETKGRSQKNSQYAIDTMDPKQKEEAPL